MLTNGHKEGPESPDDPKVAPDMRFREAEIGEIGVSFNGSPDRAGDSRAPRRLSDIFRTKRNQVPSSAFKRSIGKFGCHHGFYCVGERVDPKDPLEPGMHRRLVDNI